MQADALGWLDGYAADRADAGLRRSLTARRPGESGLDLASNDYLGPSRHPRVLDAAAEERGVFRFEGRMVDEPVLRHARALLSRGAR